MREKDLYKPVSKWLRRFLKEKHPNWEVKALDSSQVYLSNLIFDLGLTEHFPEYKAYEIKVDVVGFAISGKRASLTLVECKSARIGLKDISQLLGYSIVAKPECSFIVSPQGMSSAVSYLLQDLKKYDILKYSKGKLIRVCRWDVRKKDIVRPTTPPIPLLPATRRDAPRRRCPPC